MCATEKYFSAFGNISIKINKCQHFHVMNNVWRGIVFSAFGNINNKKVTNSGAVKLLFVNSATNTLLKKDDPCTAFFSRIQYICVRRVNVKK